MTTATKTLDLDALIAAVREVAAEQPDFVYTQRHPAEAIMASGPTCTYERHGEPSCIVGQGLFRTGVPVEELARFDRGAANSGFEGSSIAHVLAGEYGLLENWEANLLSEGEDVDTDSRIEWLVIVQSEQDRGVSWGDAVTRADQATGLGA